MTMTQQTAVQVTPAQFRATYHLSAEQFKRLSKAAKEQTDQPITVRQGRNWYVSDPDFLADVLATEREQHRIESAPTVEPTAPIDPHSELTQNLPRTSFTDSLQPIEPTPRTSEIQITSGNHRAYVDPGAMPQSVDLAQFRAETTVELVQSPGDIAVQAMAAIDGLIAGMDADLQQQQQRLQETQQATQQLRQKAKVLEQKKLEYMIQSSTTGQAQAQSTAELTEAVRELQGLGKSPATEPLPQQQ